MISFKCIAFVLITIVLSGCHKWLKDQSVDGIKYTKVRFVDENKDDSNGIYSVGYLKEPTQIGGLSYSGWLHLRNNGSVAGGLLHHESEVNGIKIPFGTWVSFDNDGNLLRCHFPENKRIQGYSCIGTGGAKGVTVTFYPSGKLKYFFSPKNVEIDGILCKGSVFNIIGLHENGRLMTATAAEDIEYDGISINKGTQLELDENGNLTNP